MQNIHPIFVHFPIALLSVGILFDVLGYYLKKPSLSKFGWWCFALGVLSAIVTVFTRLQAAKTVPENEKVHEVMENHERFQIYSTVILTGLLVWRSIKKGVFPRLVNVYFVVAALAVATILYGSHFGGRLVYEYGVGTAVQPPATKSENHQNNPSAETKTQSDSKLLTSYERVISNK